MVEEGVTERAAAAALSVTCATAHRWKRRWLAASEQDRRSGGWARDRSSRPHRSPSRTDALVEQSICEQRRRTGWGPRLIAGEVGVAHFTVHAVLRRHGLSRGAKASRAAFCRYEWPCPGDLLHMDVKRYPRFARPGHAVTGDRHKTRADKRNALGYDSFHAVVDDHSRLAYGELLADEKAATVTALMQRALAWFADRAIPTKRVMTDGGWSSTHNRALGALLAQREIGHIITLPYTPRWNGKVERFHQIMEREWAKGLRYRNSTATNRALPHWLHYYNERRPHSSLGSPPPISRAHNLPRQDT
jgi:transposase InsO family protein